MNVLFVAVFAPGSTNLSQEACLTRQGAVVHRFSYRDKWGSSHRRDQKMVEQAIQNNCKLVLISKGDGIQADAIAHLRERGIKVFLWYMDPLHNFGKDLEQRIWVCDRTFCALQEPHERAREMVGDRAIFLQEGFDPDADKPVPTKYRYNVSFIGQLYGSRGQFIKATSSDAHVLSGVYGKAHAEAVCASRINLNFTKGGTSDRTYKILAAGGFLLTQPWPGMDDDFTEERDFVTFTTPEVLKEQIKRWLPDEQGRRRIAEHGRETVQKFSRNNWARKILEIAK